ncbi:MAG: SDR family oxidoreductase [Pseudomonadota bacterium]
MTFAAQPKHTLLTGASGVVGTEVVKCLPADHLLLGRHRAVPEGPARQVSIDIRRPNLGLDRTGYSDLADSISAIVHCAAVTDMKSARDDLMETNVAGARHMTTLAKEASVPLHFVSTAYCSREVGPKTPVQSAYIRSKRAAEDIVRGSAIDWTILRPSIVVGHSQTGEIASFQGFHLFITAILKGRLPFIPLEPEAHCDFVPADYIAAAIKSILRAPVFGRTYWLTAGRLAMTIQDMLNAGRPFAAKLGRDLDTLQFAAPETIQRDLLPTLETGAPKRVMERLNVLMELGAVMATERPFPTDLPAVLPHEMPVSAKVLRQVFEQNLRVWGRANGQSFDEVYP